MASKKIQTRVSASRKKKPSLQARGHQAQRKLKLILSAILNEKETRGLLRKRGIRTETLPSSLQVDIQVVGPARMARINQEWRGKAYATDILSFPAPDFFQKQGLLGELIVCWSTAEKQARSCNHAAQTELTVLLVHGVLHLLGLDHERSAQELKKQARLETLLLQQMGIRAKSGLIERMNPT